MKNIIFTSIFLLFISCTEEVKEYLILCYSVERYVPYPDETMTVYCDTIVNGKRFYSKTSTNFRLLNKIDSILKHNSLQINDTIRISKNNEAIIEDTLIINEKMYYRCLIWSGDIAFYSAHNKDFGTLLAKFDYRTYLKLNTVEKRDTKHSKQISIEKDMNAAIKLLKGYGGWDF